MKYHFPAPGQSIDLHQPQDPPALGLKPDFIPQIKAFVQANLNERYPSRWAVWRHGYLAHVEGDFNTPVDVASLRKTWHALIVGAAIKEGKIPSLNQKISAWLPELSGPHAEATWRHVITQSAGFDYPYGDYPAFQPGQMWTYSDWNLVHLCNALARVYGKRDFYDDYAEIARTAYFEALGMQGWSTKIVFDQASQMDDGVRFVLSLEHMGRLGLFALARGNWDGVQLVNPAFVESLETKQTYGMQVNYDGPNDGQVHLRFYAEDFPECPYGYLTWVNTDGDYFPGADKNWAFGAGAGGSYILWNYKHGLVFAAIGTALNPSKESVSHILEASLLGSNPLVK